MKNSSPIAIFDSGVGGLSVLDEISKILPNENLIYVADSRNAPYGLKSFEEIYIRASKIINFLLKNHELKLIVVACNTATAACIKKLREVYDVPLVGMEPAVKPAIQLSKKKCIGILATEGTIKSAKFSALLENYYDEAKFYIQPCIGLVEYIEKGQIDTLEVNDVVCKNLAALKEKKVDVIVLGCTHFLFIKSIIEDYFDNSVRIIDTGKAVANRVVDLIGQNDSLNGEANNLIQFYSNIKYSNESIVKRLSSSTIHQFFFNEDF